MDRQSLINLAYAAEKKYGLPKGLLVAQLHQESSDGTNTANPEGPVGVMQIQPGTAKALGFDPTDPAQAIDGAGKIMAHNIAQSGGDAGHALKLYYAGSEKGIGPRSNAYPGQVTSKWATPDLVDDVTDFSDHPAPATPTNTPAAVPAAPEGDDFDFSGDHPTVSVTAAAPGAPSAPASGDQLANMQRLNAEAIAAGKVPPFEKLLDRTTGHTVAGDSQAGFVQGAKNTFATLNNLAVSADNAVPALNMLDQAASGVIPGVAPNKLAQASAANLADRNRFNSAYDSQYSDFGQMTGAGVSQAPLMMAGGGLVGAGARAIGGEGVNPLLQFMAGKGGSGMLGRAGSLSTAGAIAGGSGAAMSSAGSDAPLLDQVGQGATAGAVAGPILGALTGGYAGTGAKIDPIKAQNLLDAKALGIEVPYGRVSPSPLVRKTYSMLGYVPGSGVGAEDAAQVANWNTALRGQLAAGDVPAPRDLTPASMGNLRRGLSNNYEQIGARTSIDTNASPLVSDLAAWEQNAKDGNLADMHPKISGMVDKILNEVEETGVLPGKKILSLTSTNGPLLSSTDPNVARLGKQLKGILNDHLKANASPEDAATLDATNKSWGLMRTIERSAANSDGSSFSPQTLQNRLTVNYGPGYRAYNDMGPVGTLADVGQYMAPERSSGSPEGIQSLNILKLLGAGGAGALGMHFGVPPEVALEGLGALAGTSAAARIAASRLQNPRAVNRLIAASLNDNPPAPINYIPQALGVIGNNALTAISAPQRRR